MKFSPRPLFFFSRCPSWATPGACGHFAKRFVGCLVLLLAVLGSAQKSAAQQGTEAAAYVIMDHASGHILEEFNAAKKLQVASLTKIVTACVVLDWAHATKKSVDQPVTIPPFSKEVANSQGIQWIPGDQTSVKELLYAMLMQSDNVAAETLCRFVGAAISGGGSDPELQTVSFVAQMNALARKLGMLNSRFLNAHGLDTLERKRPYSSAEDLARVSAYAMANPSFVFYVSQKERRISITHPDGTQLNYKLINTNQLLGRSGIDGVKTGTTKRAGECLVLSAERPPESRKEGDTFFITPRRLHIVVLNAENRFALAQNLLQRGWAAHEAWVSAGRPELPRPK